MATAGIACNDDAARPRGDACSDAGAVTREELDGGAPALCEHQVLVAPLRASDDYSIPLRIQSGDEIEICFEDDNAEAHRAWLLDGAETRLALTAGRACARERLAPGVYRLRLQHVARTGTDSSPDVVHTRLVARGADARRLLISVNACPGCDLRNKPWPYLGPDALAPAGAYGYDGDYAGAHFDGSVCKHPEDSASSPRWAKCALGYAADAAFDGATFDGVTFGPHAFLLFFGRQFEGAPGAPTPFAKASFKRVQAPANGPRRVVFAGAFTGAEWTGSNFGRANVSGVFRETVPSAFARAQLSAIDVDVAALREFQRVEAVVAGARVFVAHGDDLSRMTLDAASSFVWPEKAGHVLDVSGMSFAGATVRDVVFPCVGAGDLTGAHFEGATLERVTFSQCDLGRAHFAGATLRGVVARQASLVKTDLTDLVVDGLDITGSTVGGPLSTARGGVANRLVAADVTGALFADQLVAPKANFFHATLTDAHFADAKLVQADFGSATLDRTDFTGAVLDKATFTDAHGATTRFPRASLIGATMDKLRLVGADLEATHLETARFTAGRVCGGSGRGTFLAGTNLGGTLFPKTSNTYTIGGETFECQGVADHPGGPQTSAATTCPNLQAGPCTGDATWIPVGLDGVCCDPWDTNTWTGPTCDRDVAGQACTTNCDCASLRCVAGKCG